MFSELQVKDMFKKLPKVEKTFFQYWSLNFRYNIKQEYVKYVVLTENTDIDFTLFSMYFYLYSPEAVAHNLN